MELGQSFYLTYIIRQSLGILISTTVLLPVCCLVTDVSVASECWTFHHIAHFGVIFAWECSKVWVKRCDRGVVRFWDRFESWMRPVGEVITAWQSRYILPSHDSCLAPTVWNVACIKSSWFIRAAAQSPVGQCWHVNQSVCVLSVIRNWLLSVE